MSRSVIRGARMYVLLSWVDALENGYGTHKNAVQPPTISNLAAYTIRDGAMEDWIEDRYSIIEARDPVDEKIYRDIKVLYAERLREYYGRHWMGRTDVLKTEDTHLAIRQGYDKQKRRNVTAYSLTQKGEGMLERLEEIFEEKSRASERTFGEVTYDRTVVPVENRRRWSLEEKRIPRLDKNGECVDTGTRVKI